MTENDHNIVIASEPRIECVRFLAWSTDSLLCGTLLSYILSWQDNHSHEFLTESDANLSNILGMSESEFREAKRACMASNFITVARKGFPSKTLYKLNFDYLREWYQEYLESEITVKRVQMLKNLTLNSELILQSDVCAQLENQANTPVRRIPVSAVPSDCIIELKTQSDVYDPLENQAGNSDFPPFSIKSATTNLPATIDSYNTINNKENNIDSNINVNESNVIESNNKKMNKNGRIITKNSIEYELAALLFEMIHHRRPNFHGEAGTIGKQKHQKILSWAGHIRLMIERDKRGVSEIFEVIEWVQNDYFWKDNVLSTRKLRSQFGQLQIRIEEQDKQNQTPLDTHPEITQVFIKNFQKVFLNGRKPVWSNKDMGKFISAAEKSVDMAAETNLPVESIPDFIIEALKCYKNNNCCMVHVGHLCAANTWDVLLPQYLKDVGVTIKNV